MIRNTSNVKPRAWGGSCQTWELLSGKDLVVFRERMPAGTAEVEHYHKQARQFFFVLDGELTITLNGVEHTLKQYVGLEIPPGEVHRVHNTSSGTTEFLAIAHPSTMPDRHIPAS